MDNLIDAHIQLRDDLYARLVEEARQRNISVSEVIKRRLEADGYDRDTSQDFKPKDWRDKMKSMETKKKK